jgi:uncharacterized repeat protein (TIGR01451 family)
VRKIKTLHKISRARSWLALSIALLMLAAIPLTFLEKTNAAAGNLTWTANPAAEANNWTSVAWSPELNLFAAVSNIGSTNRVMTSPDGVTWTSRAGTGANDHWRSVVWSSGTGLFVAIGSGGGANKVMTSPDGITWTSRTPSEAGDWVAVTWSPDLNLFVAVGNGGSRVMTSPNGINWTSRTAAQGNAWTGVTWSPQLNLFVAVSTNGTNRVMTSPDGIAWTVRTAAAANDWRSVAWSPELGLFVAVAPTGTNQIMTSPDGITWTGRSAPEANAWGAVAWSPERGVFAAVASSGTNRIMTSSDGINWTGQAAPEANSWTALAWAPALNSFGAVGASGTNRTMLGTSADAVGPGGVGAGLYSWQRADDGTASGATWQDSSGNGRDAAQATAGSQPTFTASGINFNPALQFDGTDDFMAIGSLNHTAATNGEELFAAVLPDAAIGNGNIIGWGDAASSSDAMEVRYTNNALQYGAGQPWSAIINPAASAGSAQITNAHRFKNDTTPAKLLLNGTEVASGTVSARTTDDRMDIGARRITGTDNQVFNGLMSEVIFFDRQLTQAERQKVASYMGVKYGVTLSHDYIDSAGTTIWDRTVGSYNNDIAGIGRDDSSELDQKQSKSVNTSSIVTVGHGDIAASNQANTNDFSADKSFMTWGHDGANTDQTANVNGTSYKRMNRIWKTEAEGAVGAVEMQIPTSAITRNEAVLLVSDSPTFDNTSQVVTTTSAGGNYAATTTLAAGTHYFTFASPAGSDIATTKTATDPGGTPIANYTPGEPIEYAISVVNNGPDNAGTVTVTDTLPAGVVPTAASGGGWSCNIAGQTVTCTRAALNDGVTAPSIIIDADIASSVTGQKNNTASATVADDPDTSNNDSTVTLDASLEADLGLSKQDMSTPVAGNNFDYKFTVTNNGPSDISGFTITDTLPTDLTYVSDTPDICGGSSGQNITCTSSAALVKDQVTEVTVTVHVDPGYGGGALVNTATVAVPGGVTDPNPSNNSSTNNSSVDVETDLTISKTHVGNFVAGQSNDFTVAVTNNGPSNAPVGSVTVTDTLSGDLSYVSASNSDWNCSEQNGTVTCTNLTEITSLGTTDFILKVAVEPIVRGTVDNTAIVSSTTPDPDTTNNSSTDAATIVAETDLAITKTHVESSFIAGQQAHYDFTVTNNGPSADTPSFTVTDNLPTGLTFAAVSGDLTSTACTGTTSVTCTGPSVAVGETLNFRMTVDVAGSATGTLNNSATVSPPAGTIDQNPGNNTANDTVDVAPNADLVLVKTPPASLTAGDTEDYVITVTNDGPSDVSSFTVTDTLDPNLTYQSATGATCNAVGQDVTCDGGAITSGNNVVITLTVEVAANAVLGYNVSNTADVAPPADVNDPDINNNTDTVSSSISGNADLSIQKSHTGNFFPATNNTFTFEVTNDGPSDVQTYTITDVLPDEFSFVSATGDANCSSAGQTVTCIGGEVLPSSSKSTTITVAVSPGATGTIPNTATVSSAVTDPNPGNNSSLDSVTMDTATADLTATKTAQGTLTAGEPVTYRFEVTNNGGPDTAGEVTIQDSLPSYLSYQSANSVSGGTWDCAGSSGQNVTCVLPTLATNDTSVVDVTVLVAADAPTPAENNASVTFNGTDPTLANPSTSNPVSYAADLEVQLSHESETYHSGDTVDFTYTVINHGPSQAEDVVLADTLPEGLMFESLVASKQQTGDSLFAKAVDTILGAQKVSAAPNTPFDCSNSGQNITCNASALDVGTYTITMTALISSSFTGNLTSIAQITSSTPDPNNANNMSIDTIVNVTAPSGLANTGTNLAIVLSASLVLIIGTAILAVWRRRRAALS